ncbi:PAS domain S-box protein [Rhodobacter capsulatus]|uniref:PAS domain S-box protein n=1 Tax=Rhodobacter capsulatus TaxID=1061 RepID=A0A4U1JNS7_RHOCA|nr:methyl-accepting chemotaxis protein [Rhodobacter capsulatus]TKD17392.1 PAS domain S-box protein [Rhodobacter capsulatus]
MPFLKSLKLRLKLPLMLVTIAVGALAVMGVSSYREARNLLLEQGSQRLEHALQTRTQGAQGWADQVQSELRAMAGNQGTARLMRDFSGAWKMLGAGAADNLRHAWVETNPNPEAERWKLDFAGDINDFGIIHRRAHPGFVTQSKERGLADLFFVDPKGRVLYSLRKGPEFAADLTDPALQQSPLAQVVAKAQANPDQVPQISDFVAAGPGGAPVIYLAQTVRSAEGVSLGVLAFAARLDPLLQMITAPQSLGDTGQAYLVDGSGILQTQLRAGAAVPPGTPVQTPAVTAALAGETGRIEQTGVDGGSVLAVHAPLQLFGRPMALVVEQSDRELFAPARELARKLGVNAALLIAVLAAISTWMARGIGRPLHDLAAAVNRISRGDHALRVPGTGSQDEVGEIAQAVEALRGDLAASEATRHAAMVQGTAFRNSSAALMVVGSDLTITYVNTALIKLVEAKLTDFRIRQPELQAGTLVGQSLAALYPLTAEIEARLQDPTQLPFRRDVAVGEGRYGVDFSEIRTPDGAQLGFVVEWRDVTELRMTRALLSALDSTQLMLEFSPAGRVARGNANLLAALGETEATLTGRSHAGLIEGEGALAGFWARLERLEPVIGRFTLIRADGARVVAEGSVTPVPDRAGNMLKIVLIANDITEAQSALELARARNETMLAEQRGVVEALRVGLEDLARGDLGSRIVRGFPPEYEQLRTDFNNAATTLGAAMLVVIDNAQSIDGEVSEITNAASDLSQRTERQAATLAETVTALDQLTTSIGAATASISEADQVVERARIGAESSGRVVQEAVSAMGEIAESSQKISRIIGVIEDIAFQTNLLALNAGVEAARAGEAGRGFAVVASEVRALAQRSSAAAQEISGLISASSDHVQVGVDLVGQTGQALDGILVSVNDISGRVSKIASSAREQSTGLSEINRAMIELDQVTQQNAAMFEETTAAAQALSRGVQALTATTARFRAPEPAEVVVTPPAVVAPAVKLRPPKASAPPRSRGALAIAEDGSEWVDF